MDLATRDFPRALDSTDFYLGIELGAASLRFQKARRNALSALKCSDVQALPRSQYLRQKVWSRSH